MTPLEHLLEFYQISQLPMHYVTKAEETQIGEYAALKPFFPEVEETLFQSKRSVVYTVSPNHAAFVLIRLPARDEYLFLGPAIPFELTRESVEEMIAYGGGDIKRADELQGCLHSLPKRDLTNLLAIAGYLCRTVFYFSPSDFTYLDYPLPATQAEQFLSERPNVEQEEAFPDPQLKFFQALPHAISHGQVDRVKTLVGQIFQISPAPQEIQLQTVRTSFLLALSMSSFSAMQGGCSLTMCSLLMNDYLLQLEHTHSIRQIVQLMKTMMTDFAIRVHQCQIITTSDPISRKICREVEEHLYEKITPTMIAARLGYSVSYLCNHFKSVTGMTINDYIHQRKMEEAKAFLEQPGANVTETAMKLGYSTPSYFCTVFKRETGTTPAEYLRSQ